MEHSYHSFATCVNQPHSVDIVVGHQCEEFGKLRIGHQFFENLRSLRESSRVVAVSTKLAAQLREFFLGELSHHFSGDGPSVLQFGGMPNPLPNLGAADLCSGSVFHQVIDRHTTRAAATPPNT